MNVRKALGFGLQTGAIYATAFSFLVVAQSGCVTTNFTQPVASFQQSVNTSSVAIATYYKQLNIFERRLYFDNLVANPGQKLLAVDESGNYTPFGHSFFAPAAIKARTDSLILLGVYAQRLTDLAGADPGAKVATNAQALGAGLANLDKTFTALSAPQAGKATVDPKAAKFAGPVSALIGSLGKMYVDSKRDEAIKEAVDNGAPKVDQILNLLESDFTEVIQPLRTTGLKIEEGDAVRAYNTAVEAYNKQCNKLPEAERNSGCGKFAPAGRANTLTSIGQIKDAYDAAVTSDPSTLIQSIRTAHTALVKYADAPKSPQSFSDFMSAMQTFDQRAQEVATDVKNIKAVE
jgi:hypothetical protein